MANEAKIYNLEERTARFSETIIDFVKKVPKNFITMPILDQLIRSSTSIGANYCEANCAESKKDFEHKIGICKKESSETKYWLRILARSAPELVEDARVHWKEVNELNLIFITIVRNSQKTEY